MISFRYHIVSIVSLFLALAVGVALGGGPLKGEVDNTLVEQVEAVRQARQAVRKARRENPNARIIVTGVNVAPRYAFGHGLGYTSWEYVAVDAPPARALRTAARSRTRAMNTDARSGASRICWRVPNGSAATACPIRRSATTSRS